jgi:O-antigen ligase
MLWILIGYMFLFVHRPFEVWPALGDMHFERFYMLGTLLAALPARKRWLPNWQHAAHLTFAAVVALCWVASPWADRGEQLVEDYFKILVFYLLLVLLVHDERALERVLLAFLVIMFVYMSHSLWEYMHGRHTFRMGIARMIGVDKSLGDPNSFGASILYALPFVVPFWVCRPSRLLRAFLVAFVGLSFVCIGLTGSRGSLVGLVLLMLILVLRSRWRWRLLAVGVLASPLLFAALPPSLQTRFETIVNPEVGPANAQSSALARLEGLQMGLQLWGRYPITGCGPGAFRPATGSPLESHNLYGELLGETGSLGAIAFLGILAAYGMNLLRVRRAYQQHPEWGKDLLYEVTVAITIALFMLLFLGNFGHNLFRFSWLWYGGFLVIIWHCLQERMKVSPFNGRAGTPWASRRVGTPALGQPAYLAQGARRRPGRPQWTGTRA